MENFNIYKKTLLGVAIILCYITLISALILIWLLIQNYPPFFIKTTVVKSWAGAPEV